MISCFFMMLSILKKGISNKKSIFIYSTKGILRKKVYQHINLQLKTQFPIVNRLREVCEVARRFGKVFGCSPELFLDD